MVKIYWARETRDYKQGTYNDMLRLCYKPLAPPSSLIPCSLASLKLIGQFREGGSGSRYGGRQVGKVSPTCCLSCYL